MRKRVWAAAILLAAILLLPVLSSAGFGPGNGCAHEWEMTGGTPAACTREGKEVYTCRLCGKKKTVKTPALGHDWSFCTVVKAPTCTEDGLSRCTCSRNPAHVKEEVLKAAGHSWGEWTTVSEPGLTSPGLRSRICSRCGAEETDQTPPLVRRKEYELKLQVFPDGSGLPGVPQEDPGGLFTEWICAVANTGKKDLWILGAQETPGQERVFLAAGQVMLVPLRAAVPAESAELELQFFGETEDGERVCESERVTRPLAAGSPDPAAEPDSLVVSQELVSASEREEGYRVGEVVRWSVSVANHGNESMPRVEITDAGTDKLVLEDLAPGETRTAVREHRVSTQNAVAGFICWAVTAEAVGPDDAVHFSAVSAPVIVPVTVR